MGLYRDSGKEHGNYYNIGVIMGLYRYDGKENGNYYILGVITGLYKGNGKQMETAILHIGLDGTSSLFKC